MVNVIRELIFSGIPGHDIAILYPQHDIADLIEERLAQAYIPYLRHGHAEPRHR